LLRKQTLLDIALRSSHTERKATTENGKWQMAKWPFCLCTRNLHGLRTLWMFVVQSGKPQPRELCPKVGTCRPRPRVGLSDLRGVRVLIRDAVEVVPTRFWNSPQQANNLNVCSTKMADGKMDARETFAARDQFGPLHYRERQSERGRGGLDDRFSPPCAKSASMPG